MHVLVHLLKHVCLAHYKNVSLTAQCTDSDGCAVDRARAWCEMIDTIYHRSETTHVLVLVLFLMHPLFSASLYLYQLALIHLS